MLFLGVVRVVNEEILAHRGVDEPKNGFWFPVIRRTVQGQEAVRACLGQPWAVEGEMFRCFNFDFAQPADV